jgi:hypothetical protein
MLWHLELVHLQVAHTVEYTEREGEGRGREREREREGEREREREGERERGREREREREREERENLFTGGLHSLKTRRSFFVRKRRQHVTKVTKVKTTPTTMAIANPAIAMVPFTNSGIVVIGSPDADDITHINLHKDVVTEI